MNRIKILKRIGIPLLIFSLYYISSVLLSPSGKFIRDNYLIPSSKEDALAKEILIKSELDKITKINDNCPEVVFFLSKVRITRQFGFLPLEFSFDHDTDVLLDISFTASHVNNNKIYVQFDNHPDMTPGTLISRRYEANAIVDVKFKDTNDKLLCEMQVMLEK